eukprot:550666-Pelagomonas_calceolata.AAC.1
MGASFGAFGAALRALGALGAKENVGQRPWNARALLHMMQALSASVDETQDSHSAFDILNSGKDEVDRAGCS